jgi:antitoxin StbD
LNHNRPAFYMVSPKLFETLVEEMADRDLVEVARQRLTLKESAIDVDIDQI